MKHLKTFHNHLINKSDVSKVLNFRKNAIAIALLTLTFFMSTAQNQMFYIHQDFIIPEKSQEYKDLTKSLVQEFKTHGFKHAMNTVQLSNGSIISITPINKMADLDLNVFEELSEKIGAEKWKKMFEDFDKCYDKHTNFISTYLRDLSYTPKGESKEGYNYVEYHFFHIKPGTEAKFTEKVKALKAIYEKTQAPGNFATYHSGFGAPNDYFIVAVFAKDEVHLKELTDNDRKIIGKEGTDAINAVYKASASYELLLGWYLPDLSYNPKQ